MNRLPPLDPTHMTSEQKRVYDDIVGGRRGRVEGPLEAWLRSPDLADPAQKLGEFCRFGTTLGPVLSELAILITAKHHRAQFEWWAHAKIASEAGLAADVIAALKAGEKPRFEDDRQAVLYAFCTELVARNRVAEATYRSAVTTLGETAVVELVGVMGYYALVALTLNAFDIPLPEGVAAPFAD